jgi:Undecaprenyl-phosphate glucose phosphotransferase
LHQDAPDASTAGRRDARLAHGRRISLQQRVVLFLLADVLAIVGFGLLPILIGSRFGLYSSAAFEDQTIAIALTIILFLFISRVVRVYSNRRILDQNYSVRRLLTALCVTFAVLLAIGAAMKTSQAYSRLWFFSWAGLTCALAPMGRFIALAVTRKQLENGAFVFRAMSAGIFSDPLEPEEIARRTNNQVRTDYVLRLESLDQLERFADTIARDEIDQIYLVAPWVDAPLLLQKLQHLRQFSAEVFVLPDDGRIHSHQLGVAAFGDRLSLKAVDRAIDGWDLWLKRAQDIVVSATILTFFSPALAAIAIAIKLDGGGPVLFRQRRVGFNGRTFELWKFRSMYEEAADADAVLQTGRSDARVTRVGRFIRRTSLDELPQFFNVLQGAMSVVGPRPHALKTQAGGQALEDVADRYAARHRVKPGLTGWAQINGLRGELDTIEKVQKRVEYDIEYIENWSTGFDLKIILRTAILLVYDPSAY